MTGDEKRAVLGVCRGIHATILAACLALGIVGAELYANTPHKSAIEELDQIEERMFPLLEELYQEDQDRLDVCYFGFWHVERILGKIRLPPPGFPSRDELSRDVLVDKEWFTPWSSEPRLLDHRLHGLTDTERWELGYWAGLGCPEEAGFPSDQLLPSGKRVPDTPRNNVRLRGLGARATRNVEYKVRDAVYTAASMHGVLNDSREFEFDELPQLTRDYFWRHRPPYSKTDRRTLRAQDQEEGWGICPRDLKRLSLIRVRTALTKESAEVVVPNWAYLRERLSRMFQDDPQRFVVGCHVVATHTGRMPDRKSRHLEMIIRLEYIDGGFERVHVPASWAPVKRSSVLGFFDDDARRYGVLADDGRALPRLTRVWSHVSTKSVVEARRELRRLALEESKWKILGFTLSGTWTVYLGPLVLLVLLAAFRSHLETVSNLKENDEGGADTPTVSVAWLFVYDKWRGASGVTLVLLPGAAALWVLLGVVSFAADSLIDIPLCFAASALLGWYALLSLAQWLHKKTNRWVVAAPLVVGVILGVRHIVLLVARWQSPSSLDTAYELAFFVGVVAGIAMREATLVLKKRASLWPGR